MDLQSKRPALEEAAFRRGPAVKRYSSDACLVCGRDNPVGLRARFCTDGRMAWSEVNPPLHFQGFEGILHGGMVTALLDEALWYAIYAQGGLTLTVDLQVRLRRAARPGQLLIAEAVTTGKQRKLWEGEARLLDADGNLLASASGRFMEVPQAHLQGTIHAEALGGA